MDVGEGCWLLRIEVVSSTSRLLKLEEIDGTVIEVGCHSLFRKSFFTRSFLFGSIVVATDDDRTMTFIFSLRSTRRKKILPYSLEKYFHKNAS